MPSELHVIEILFQQQKEKYRIPNCKLLCAMMKSWILIQSYQKAHKWHIFKLQTLNPTFSTEVKNTNLTIGHLV